MFWKRKQPVIRPLGTIEPLFNFLDTPARKQFKNMYDLLKEAERLDNIGEPNLSKDILTVLYNYICEFQREEP